MLRPDQIITLLPFEDEPEQKARYLGDESADGFTGVHMVQLLPEFRRDSYDDGLRECLAEHIKELCESEGKE